MNRFLNWAKLLLGWPLSILALVFIIKLVVDRGGKLSIGSSEINFSYLVVSILFFFIYFLMRSFLWQKTLEEKGHKIPFLENTYRFAMSEFKRYVPGNIWSFLSRGSLFGELGVDKKILGVSILADIQLVIIGCGVVSVLAVPWLLDAPPELKTKLFTLLPISLVAIFIYFFVTGLIYQRKYDKKASIVSSFFLPGFGLRSKAKLSLISVATYFIFGVGSYFSFISVFKSDPTLFLSLAAFFVFSLLLGYVSFITPMGLGVREGVVTLGLSKITSLTHAGVISIFTRIVLIASELLFLSILLVVHQISNSKKVTQTLKTHGYEIALFILATAYTLYFTIATFLKHDNFYTGRFDLGNMDQTVWNTIHGRVFQLTDPNGTEIVSRLAFHSDFILVLLSPLYLLWESPKMLLLTQSIILAFGGIFVYAISQKVLDNKKVSLALAAAYFINPAINYTNLFDFHSVTLATTFFLGAIYFMLRKKYLPMTLFLILAGITKEQIWVITALFGAYIFLFNKRRMLGASIFTISFLIFYILIWHAIPNTSGSQHFALQFYSDYGESPTDVIKNIFLDPVSTIKTLFQKDQMDYIRKVFLPTGYLSAFSPLTMLFALPDIAINLLSQNKQMHEIYYQYSSAITPFVFVSTILGFKNIKKIFPFLSYENLAALVFVLSLISAYAYGPLPLAKKPQTVMFTELLENREVIEKTLSEIPKEKSVSASNNLGAHLSQRERIYVIPNGIDQADVVVILAKDDKKTLESLRQVSQDPSYVLVFRDREFYMFQKIGDL